MISTDAVLLSFLTLSMLSKLTYFQAIVPFLRFLKFTEEIEMDICITLVNLVSFSVFENVTDNFITSYKR